MAFCRRFSWTQQAGSRRFIALLAYGNSLFLASAQVAQEVARPAALIAAEASRTQIGTGYLEWRTMNHWQNRARNYTSRFASNGYTITDRGDDEGVLYRRRDGSPEPVKLARQPRNMMRVDGLVWEHREESAGGSIFKGRRRGAFDVRAVGVSPTFSANVSVSEGIWKEEDGAPRSYSSRVEDGLHVVVAETERGTITWWIDPERGFSPVRVRRQLGEHFYECKSTLKQFDGVWFPESVAYFRSGYHDGNEPLETITIRRAEFNRPGHPARIVPGLIGIEVGTNLTMHVDGNMEASLSWDGDKVITRKVLYERLAAGKLRLGANYSRIVRAGLERQREADKKGEPGGGRHYVRQQILSGKTHEGFWESYVKDFIRKHRLDADQTEKAQTILKDCQERAQAHLTRHREEIAKIDKRTAELLKTPESESRSAELLQLAKRGDELVAPINTLFQKRLQPRLERIPTQQQREAAEAAEAERHRPGRKITP